MSKKRLYKSRKNKMIDGVCGGIAEYFNIDPTIVRILAVIIGCIKGAGLLIYILACIIIPANPDETEDFEDDDVDNLKSANMDSSDKKTKSKSKEKADDKSEKSIHSDSDFDSYFK